MLLLIAVTPVVLMLAFVVVVVIAAAVNYDNKQQQSPRVSFIYAPSFQKSPIAVRGARGHNSQENTNLVVPGRVYHWYQ